MRAHRPGAGLARSLPRAVCAAGLLALLALVAVPGRAARAADPTLGHLALGWLLGDWVEPIVCEIHGSPTRALRRVLVSPVPTPTGEVPTARLQFPDPDAPGATRCFSDLGGDEPRIEGTLVLGFEGRPRPDTAKRDFESALRRSGGFEFRIRSGRLKRSDWGEGAPAATELDFTGGTARAHAIRPGSDAARLVDELRAQRGVTVELEAPGGEHLTLQLVQRPGR